MIVFTADKDREIGKNGCKKFMDYLSFPGHSSIEAKLQKNEEFSADIC